MENIATSPKGIPAEIVNRVQIALFWGICLLLGNTLLAPVRDGVLYASLAALLELFTIQAMRGLFGNTPLVRDANELNFYAFLLHLLAILIYLHGAASDWHNHAIHGIVIFYLVRLLYFGKRRADGEFSGWVKFGALGWATYFIERAANTVTKQRVWLALRIFIILATIVPLWIITALTHDQTTALYTVLTTAFILIYGYVKHSQAAAPSVLKNTTGAGKADLAATKDDFNDFSNYHMLALGVVIASFATFAMLIHSEGQKNYLFGYASGFADGKNGVEPKAEIRMERLVQCFEHGQSVSPLPADFDCADLFKAVPAKK